MEALADIKIYANPKYLNNYTWAFWDFGRFDAGGAVAAPFPFVPLGASKTRTSNDERDNVNHTGRKVRVLHLFRVGHPSAL